MITTSRINFMGLCALGMVLVLALLPLAVARAANTNSIDLERDNSQFLSIPDASQTGLDITGNLTIEAWVKIESAPTSGIFYSIASKWNGDTSNRSYMFAYGDVGGTKKLRLVWSPDGAVTVDQGDVNYDLGIGTWHHVAMVFTAASHSAEFFVDGISVGSASDTSTSILNGTASFEVGNHDGGTFYFDGLIDDVRVWNVARTNSEINTNKSVELTGSESGLVGYWKLNGDTNDLTANNNNLTATGGPIFSSDTPFDSVPPPPPPVFKVRKPTNETVTSSTILQNDDALAVTLEANKTYIVDSTIFAKSSSATPDMKIAFTAPAGAVMELGEVASAGSGQSTDVLETSGTASGRITVRGSNQPSIIHVTGTVTTGSTAGTLTLQWAQATANANGTVVNAAS